MQNLLEIVRHWAIKSPNRPLAYEGDKVFTYSEVYKRARRLSGGLKKLGITKGMRVGALMYNQCIWNDLYYGLSAAGCILVPLNWRLAGPELVYQLNDSGCKMIIFDKEFAKVVAEIKRELRTVQYYFCTGDGASVEDAMPYELLLDAEPFEVKVTENDPIAIYYTGGTTGLAKGVIATHKNILTNAFQMITEANYLSDDHVVLHLAPMFHVADGAVNFPLTMRGCSHCYIRFFSVPELLKTIERYKVTVGMFPVTILNMVINHPGISNYDISSMKLIIYGTAPIAPDLLRRCIDVFKCDFAQSYGMTEASPCLTWLHREDHVVDPANEKMMHRLRSAGRALFGVQLRVVDRKGNDVKPGEVGEVVAKADNIMVGYWGKPLETEEVLKDGWYYTKDLAQIDEDGYIYIVDRAKDMIISGGENIYSVEVENILYKHQAILEAAVIGVPDAKWGEAVKACIVLKPGAKATESEIIDFCKANIASYKSPKSVEFLDALPRSGAGKILKRELRDKYWENSERKI